jgi:hypothetical protein
MKKFNSNFLIKLVSIFTLIVCNLCANSMPLPGLERVKAKIQIKEVEVTNLHPDSTVNILLKENNASLIEVTEKDKKTVILFNIAYKAPVQVTNKPKQVHKVIHQTGLYKILDSRIRKDWVNKGLLKSSIEVDILYTTDNPNFIVIPIHGKNYQLPAMVTDSNDIRWHPL